MMLVLGAGGKAGVHGSLTQYRIAGITPATVKSYILNEMAAAISGSNWEASYTLLAMARAIENPKVKADVLNGLLVMH
jgi:hypothetical protein